MKRLTRLLVCVGVLVVSLAATASASATSGVLMVSTDTTLTEDHFGNIWLAGDSVVLDCAGHSVIGPNGGGPWPLVGIGGAARSNVTVRNCRVDGFAHGISLSSVTSFSLVGNSSSGNEKAGIALYEARHGIVSRNIVKDNGTQGIGGQNVSDIRFTLNRAEANNQNGFDVHTPWPQVHYQTDIRLVGNVSDGNGWAGFNLSEFADGSTLVANTARGNKGHGFVVGSSHNRLDANLALSNGYTGFIAANRLNPLLSPQSEPATGNTFRWNLSFQNGVFDAVDFNPAGTNSWLSNWFGTTYGI